LRLGVAIAGLTVGVGAVAGVDAAAGLAAGLEVAAPDAAWLDTPWVDAAWLEAAAVLAGDPANPDAELAGAELPDALGCPLVHPETRTRQARAATEAHREGVIWSG
jgi:hypothetical protein